MAVEDIRELLKGQEQTTQELNPSDSGDCSSCKDIEYDKLTLTKLKEAQGVTKSLEAFSSDGDSSEEWQLKFKTDIQKYQQQTLHQRQTILKFF